LLNTNSNSATSSAPQQKSHSTSLVCSPNFSHIKIEQVLSKKYDSDQNYSNIKYITIHFQNHNFDYSIDLTVILLIVQLCWSLFSFHCVSFISFISIEEYLISIEVLLLVFSCSLRLFYVFFLLFFSVRVFHLQLSSIFKS